MQSLEEINTTRHEYGLTTLQKLFSFALAAVGFAYAGFFLKLAINPVGREFALLVAFVALIAGLILVAWATRSRLILDGDRIEVRSTLRTFTANRNEIEGLRNIKNQYGRWTRICLRENRGAFNVSTSFTGNDNLNEWLQGLPDLDERDATEIKRQIRSQDSRGAIENEGLNALKQAKAWMIGLSAAAVCVSILPAHYASLHNPAMVMLAVLPPLGISLMHRFPLLFTIFKKNADPRSDMGFVVLWPGIGMIMSYKMGSDPAHLVNAFQLIYFYLLVFLCYLATLFRTAWDNPYRWGMFTVLLICGGMYSIGMMNAANSVPDRSVPRVYRTEILRMYETHGRNASFHLRLDPWGPTAYYDDVDVPKRIYQEVKVGDQICVGLHPGFLHAPWYTLVPCPEQLGARVPQLE